MSGEFQSVEAAHAGPEQSRDAFDDAGDRNTRLPAPVHDTCDDGVGQLEDFLGVGDGGGDWSAFPCQETFPLQFGNFMQEALQFLKLADGLANRVLQRLRNA